MEYIGYVILFIATVAWLILMSYTSIKAFPWGLIGLLFIVGCGFMFAKALKDRLANRQDDHYSRDVEK